MMKLILVVASMGALLFASAPQARAVVSLEGAPPRKEDVPDLGFEVYHPSAGAVVGAVAIDLVYVPVRFAVTVFGAFVGGFEGLISAGDEGAASKIFGITDGSQVITPAMLEGRERWTFGRYGW
jgi:hypothetical protein